MRANEEKCMVSGKRMYASEGEALATADHQRSLGNTREELRAFRCDWCGAWHLTKKPPKTGSNGPLTGP
jgi:hypothetical protein